VLTGEKARKVAARLEPIFAYRLALELIEPVQPPYNVMAIALATESYTFSCRAVRV
jgi:hypothetical protein